MVRPVDVARRMFLLTYGAAHVPTRLSVRGGGDAVRREPVVGALVETPAGWVLLDTGLGRGFLDDPGAVRAVYSGPPPEAPAGDPLPAALAACGAGVGVGDLALAAVSHLHADHSGGIPLLAAAGVEVAVQRAELRHAAGAGHDSGYHPPDYCIPGIRWRPLDGDAPLAPGVRAIVTPGHTPGHMSFAVTLPATGTWLLAMDAADLAWNVFAGVAGTPGRRGDDAAMEASLARLRDIAEAEDARLVPGHDPWVWRAVRHPPGGHR
jgi:N-acyl homoserine lactone hydrolase